MSHAAPVDNVLFWFIFFLTPLVMFICAMIWMPPQPASSREPPVLTATAPPRPCRPGHGPPRSPPGRGPARRSRFTAAMCDLPVRPDAGPSIGCQ